MRGLPTATLTALTNDASKLNEYDLRLALYAAYKCSQPAIEKYRQYRSGLSPRDLRQWQADMNNSREKAQAALKDLQTILKGVDETHVLELWQFLNNPGYADKRATEWLKAYLIEFGGETKFAGIEKGEVSPKMKDEMSILRTAVF